MWVTLKFYSARDSPPLVQCLVPARHILNNYYACKMRMDTKVLQRSYILSYRVFIQGGGRMGHRWEMMLETGKEHREGPGGKLKTSLPSRSFERNPASPQFWKRRACSSFE